MMEGPAKVEEAKKRAAGAFGEKMSKFPLLFAKAAFYGSRPTASRLRSSPHLSTRQYAKIVDAWVSSIGLAPNEYGTHTMRRTKATLIYRRAKNLRAVQLLLGHTKLESTVRYLGIEVDDALEIAEQTEI
jgi:integrase